jgi:hypothetical protein
MLFLRSLLVPVVLAASLPAQAARVVIFETQVAPGAEFSAEINSRKGYDGRGYAWLEVTSTDCIYNKEVCATGDGVRSSTWDVELPELAYDPEAKVVSYRAESGPGWVLRVKDKKRTALRENARIGYRLRDGAPSIKGDRARIFQVYLDVPNS